MLMKRLFCGLLMLAGLTPPAIAADARPNLLVILADDLGRGDYSAFGTPDIRTPNIDRLCREGMTFENFYANSCACSPSRAALLSGCYPDRVGVPGLVRHTLEDNWGYLSAKATLLPKALQPARYHTAIVGKWNLGLEPPNTPNDRGFDLFHGFLGDMMDDYWKHLRAGHNFLRLNREVIQPVGHATDLFTDWACSYLEQRAHAGGPFFLYLAYTAPHDPIQPPPDWLAKVQQRQPGLGEKRAKIVALIEHLDSGVGRVLGTLDRLKLAENTLVILTSDNGGNLLYGANNGPWRSGKTHMYEGGLRVPGMARWPGRIQPGSRTRHMALSMDIYPTLCAAAGIAPAADIDGVSFLPTLLGKPQPAPPGNRYFVLREGGPIFGGRTSNALIEGPWKLLQDRPDLPRELYNLQADPQETADLAAKKKQIFLRLDAAMRRHIQQGGQVPWEPEDPAAAFPAPISLPSPQRK
jgi:arylsulfatase A-like enzyme